MPATKTPASRKRCPASLKVFMACCWQRIVAPERSLPFQTGGNGCFQRYRKPVSGCCAPHHRGYVPQLTWGSDARTSMPRKKNSPTHTTAPNQIVFLSVVEGPTQERPVVCAFVIYNPAGAAYNSFYATISDRERWENRSAACAQTNATESVGFAESAEDDFISIFQEFSLLSSRQRDRILAARGQLKQASARGLFARYICT